MMSHSDEGYARNADTIMREIYPFGVPNNDTAEYIVDFIDELLVAGVDQEEIIVIIKNEFGITNEQEIIKRSKKVKNLLEVLIPVVFVFILIRSVAVDSSVLLSLIFIAISIFCFIEQLIFSFAFLRRNDELTRHARKKIMLVISLFYMALAALFGAYSQLGLEKISPILIIIITHLLMYICIQIYVKREMLSSVQTVSVTNHHDRK